VNATLDTIMEMTRQVATLAEQGEWAEATRIDAERQECLRAFCATLDPQTASADLIAALTQVLKLNDALIGTVEHRQRALVRDSETVRTGRRAVAAYGAANHSVA
jgi:hypothetical protein